MSSIDFENLSDRVRALKPLLERNRDQAERERELPAETVAAMKAAGLFRTWMPREFGGYELDPVDAMRLWEEIATVDASAAWIAANQSAVCYLTSVLPEAGGREILADPDAIVAGGWFPPAPATRVDGGYRVTGQWAFGSGARHATWLTGQGIVVEDGQPALDANGQPQLLIVFFPAHEGSIVDGTWKTLGMRGTGSNDLRVDDVFIPDSRVFRIGPIVTSPPYAGPLYGLRLWFAALPIAACALGIASAAINEFKALAAQKTPSYTALGLADRPTVQDQLARTVAKVDAARAYLHTVTSDVYAFLQGGAALPIDRGLHVQLAATHAIVTCEEAVDAIQAMAGTTGVRESALFERHFRDMHTASQHAFGSGARFESVGKLLLGRESDWGFFYL